MSKPKQPTMEEYIANNDFEGAKTRLENTSPCWRGRWFQVCQTIFNNCTDWAEHYILDPIKKAIIAIGKKIHKTLAKVRQVDTAYVYIAKIYDPDDNWIYTKIGKAVDVSKRFKQIVGKGYAHQKVGRVEAIQLFEMASEDKALTLESAIRHYLIHDRNHTLIPNDRFAPFTPTAEDMTKFEHLREIVTAM